MPVSVFMVVRVQLRRRAASAVGTGVSVIAEGDKSRDRQCLGGHFATQADNGSASNANDQSRANWLLLWLLTAAALQTMPNGMVSIKPRPPVNSITGMEITNMMMPPMTVA